MTSRERLDEPAIEAALPTVEWGRDDTWLVRQLRFPTFRDAIAFVDAVAEIAESMDHHPDIDIRWRAVTLRVSTHSAGGLTALDFELARRADALARERGGVTVVARTP